MDTSGKDKTPAPIRRIMTGFTSAIAILTCPCHLPILILLLSGTAAGAFLSANLGPVLVTFLPIFMLSALATWRLRDQNEQNPSDSAHDGPEPPATER